MDDDTPNFFEDEREINGSWQGIDGRFMMRTDRASYTDGRKRIPPDRLLGRSKIVPRLFARAMSGDPNEALNAIRHLRWRLELLELDAVALARSYGWAWQDIGAAIGLSRQTAHRRYAKAVGIPRPRRRSARSDGPGRLDGSGGRV